MKLHVPEPRPDKTFFDVFGVPIFLAALTISGLLSALIGQGAIWCWLSWTALFVPVCVILWFAFRPAGLSSAQRCPKTPSCD